MLKAQILSLEAWIYRRVVRPVFFLGDAEHVHANMLFVGRTLGKWRATRLLVRACFGWQSPALRRTVAGLNFRNPVGLAAGFDKNGDLVGILPEVGFGFMEIGSVTAKPWPGNPRPRLRRLVRSRAIVVNYGLKNNGVETFISRLKGRHIPVPLFISIAATPQPNGWNEGEAIKDYQYTLKALEGAGLGSAYTINISCPNVKEGEPFSDPEALKRLLMALRPLTRKPLFVKMPIDLPPERFRALLDAIMASQFTGVVIGNLRKDRQGIEEAPADMSGGISGRPTFDKSNALISLAHDHAGDRLVIIGVGGIFSAADAAEKMHRGASLVQLVTGMIYQGPQLIGQINAGLSKASRLP